MESQSVEEIREWMAERISEVRCMPEGDICGLGLLSLWIMGCRVKGMEGVDGEGN